MRPSGYHHNCSCKICTLCVVDHLRRLIMYTYSLVVRVSEIPFMCLPNILWDFRDASDRTNLTLCKLLSVPNPMLSTVTHFLYHFSGNIYIFSSHLEVYTI